MGSRCKSHPLGHHYRFHRTCGDCCRGVLLHWPFSNLPHTQRVATSVGFGTLHPAAIITGWAIEFNPNPAQQVLISALIANIPQLVLSFLYVNLNSLVTCVWLASEWNDYAVERKPLRVSIPSGEQRSTYFLQLPYRASLPLIAVSGLLHWPSSQSLFLDVVAEYGWDSDLVAPCPLRRVDSR